LIDAGFPTAAIVINIGFANRKFPIDTAYECSNTNWLATARLLVVMPKVPQESLLRKT
jgi:hypothetical protein